MRGGVSIATSMGMSPQSGLPHNNRVGDFDPFALPVLMEHTGQTLPQLLDELAERGGLLGLSGLSGDVRDLEEAAAAGNQRARLALDVFTSSIRQYLGACLVELGGLDAIAFAGGIGENSCQVRRAVCGGLEELGIVLDAQLNDTTRAEATSCWSLSRTASNIRGTERSSAPAARSSRSICWAPARENSCSSRKARAPA
jgi:acetate kinase